MLITANVVTNTTVDSKIMQRYISGSGIPRKTKCGHAQSLRAKKVLIVQNEKLQLLFAPLDAHISIMLAERMIQNIKK